MKKRSEKVVLNSRNVDMFDVVKDYATKYRQKKGKGISARRKDDEIIVKKDEEGAYKAFLNTIKIDNKDIYRV